MVTELPNQALDRMTRSAISRVFQCDRPGRAPRHRSALPLHRVMRLFIFIIASMVVVGGCVSPTTHSLDSEANYRYVFSDVSAPEPTIVHSHVERPHRSVLGIFPLASQYNGEWEFELLASSEWLDQVKEGFTEIPFAAVWPRQLPDWFSPSSEDFTAWEMQATSYPNAQLFVEKKPRSQDQIRVFIRRH